MKYRTFQPQFHDAIRSRIKISTIRGKQWCNVGDRVALKLWTGMPYRSKQGLIGTAVVVQVAKVEITWGIVYLDNKLLDAAGLAQLATMEGFGSWYEMGIWFEKHHHIESSRLSAILTRWDPATLELEEAMP